MQTTIKDLKNYCDLYGWSITVLRLKKLYNFVSFAKNSIPTAGSLTLSTKKLNENNDTTIKKVINHKNNTVTLVTNQGYLTFLNL